MTQRGDEKLCAQGWTRRFVGAPPRLKEVVDLYQSLGYEVRLEVQEPEELEDRCKSCALVLQMFRIVYTRSPPAAPPAADASRAASLGQRFDDDGSGES
jgi:hypothetical protein